MLKRFLVKVMEAFGAGPIERNEAGQSRVDGETQRLALYHFPSCPFCLRVRLVIDQLKLKIELRDINQSAQHRSELVAGGGRSMVPCLRIEEEGSVRWIYESSDIIRYLKSQFGHPAPYRAG